MKPRTRWSLWPAAAMVAGALLVGTVIGPAVVQAATAGLVRLEGGGSSHVAKVSSSGQLAVNPGLAQTRAHQLLAVQASPSSYVALDIANATCPAASYQAPRGDALIITGALFVHYPTTSAPPAGLGIAYGPAAKPCSFAGTFSVTNQSLEISDYQEFQPGIAIPAGDAIGMYDLHDGGAAVIYGYLVPAADVPRHPAAAGHRLSSFLPVFRR